MPVSFEVKSISQKIRETAFPKIQVQVSDVFNWMKVLGRKPLLIFEQMIMLKILFKIINEE